VGGLTPGYVNPWSTLDEVISVGAWDHTTNAVWSESSTALPDQMDAWPDVVAPGVDVISAWPTYLQKTPERKAKDEANERFRQTVPKESWDTHTMMSGTSQAAAIVTGSATQVFRFVYGVIESQDKQPGDKLFSLEGGPDRISDYDRLVPRLTGTAEPSANGGMIYTYEFDHPWKVVKQILIDTAQPIEGAKPWQAGAGLVSPDYIREQFGAFGIEPPTIVPYKVE
jgi:subtilisin family serine protease